MKDTIELIKFITEGVLLPCIGGLGLVGNLASIAVLRSRAIDLKQSFCQVRRIFSSSQKQKRKSEANKKKPPLVYSFYENTDKLLSIATLGPS